MSKENEKFQYTLKSFENDFKDFSKSFKDFCYAQKIDESKIFDMEVSLEELIVNSFSYGNAKGKVTVQAEISEKELRVYVEDESPPFNLLREAPEPPKGNLKDRKVGGLGIHLVKGLNDRVEYSGSKKGNRITLFKSLKKVD